MSSALRLGLKLGLASLTLACAAQREEGSMPEREAERAVLEDLASEAEPAAMEPASAPAYEEEQGERSLADIERELAANEAKLRALGVELSGGEAGPGLGDASGSASVTTKEGERVREREQAKDRKDKKDDKPKKGRANKRGSTSKPATRPGAPGAGGGAGAGRAARPSEKRESSDLDAADDRFAPPPPDEAKSVPLSPGEEPQQDAIGRCEQICELSAITCELNVQICELADRHDDEDDYRAACERATEDCAAAQEACDECAN